MDDGLDNVQAVPSAGRCEWQLRRNLALSPVQLAGCFIALALASLLVATPFVMMGAWPVLPFAGVEIAALGVAFAVYAVHATDGDRVVLGSEVLRVEARRGRRTVVAEWPVERVRVDVERARRTVVRVRTARQTLNVGDCVDEAQRARFAQELVLALRQAATLAPAGAGTED